MFEVFLTSASPYDGGDRAVDGDTQLPGSGQNARSLAPLAQQLTRSEVQIRSLNLRAPTLDEVFRHVVSDERAPAEVR